MNRAGPKIILSILALIPLTGVFWILTRENPETSRFPYPPCMSAAVFGIYCPGCGVTRAAHAALDLDFVEALKKNAFFVLAAPFIIYGVALRWMRWLRPNANWLPRPINWPMPVLWSIFAVMIAFGVLRNLPFEPFSLLAPR
ncbi:MAG: hypothetical protein ACI8UO_004056 [Verrucomicrobiales bacterium]|jgi:hypothetical protein